MEVQLWMETDRTGKAVYSMKHEENCFTVLHVKVRSIDRHTEELEILITSRESPPVCVCLSETWSKITKKAEYANSGMTLM